MALSSPMPSARAFNGPILDQAFAAFSYLQLSTKSGLSEFRPEKKLLPISGQKSSARRWPPAGGSGGLHHLILILN